MSPHYMRIYIIDGEKRKKNLRLYKWNELMSDIGLVFLEAHFDWTYMVTLPINATLVVKSFPIAHNKPGASANKKK